MVNDVEVAVSGPVHFLTKDIGWRNVELGIRKGVGEPFEVRFTEIEDDVDVAGEARIPAAFSSNPSRIKERITASF